MQLPLLRRVELPYLIDPATEPRSLKGSLFSEVFSALEFRYECIMLNADHVSHNILHSADPAILLYVHLCLHQSEIGHRSRMEYQKNPNFFFFFWSFFFCLTHRHDGGLFYALRFMKRRGAGSVLNFSSISSAIRLTE